AAGAGTAVDGEAGFRDDQGDGHAGRAARDGRAEEHARNAAAAAERARQSATEAQQAADRAEDQQRKEEEEARRRAAEETGAGLPDLTQEEIAMLSATEFGRMLLDEYRQAAEQSKNGGSVTSFLVEIGAEVLLEVIGWRDAERCFGEGNIEACIWTVVNVASIVVVFLKLPKVASAVVKIIQNISKFLNKSAIFRKVADKVKPLFNAIRKWCNRISQVPATAKTADIPDFTCGLVDHGDNGGTLPSIALDYRIGNGYGTSRNVAVAYLPGYKDPNGKLPDGYVAGNSNDAGRHSEQHIVEQVIEQGFDPKNIKGLYSEREPCPDCKRDWVSKMAPDLKTSFSVPWTGDPEIDKIYKGSLIDMIKKSYKRRGLFPGAATAAEAEQRVLVGSGAGG
ncbi:nucleic acid/nucleotide deaminase domain-containing protein, partial [Amycolatopsis japonica]